MRPDPFRRACLLGTLAAFPARSFGRSEDSDTSIRINSIDTIVSDMRLKNDLPLLGPPKGPSWATGPGSVVMGNDPRGSRTPAWWNPANPRFKSGVYWNAFLPWMVIWDGVGHQATNTRVQIRRLKAWIRSRRTDAWQPVGPAAAGLDGAHYAKDSQSGDFGRPDVRVEPDGSHSIRPPAHPAIYHGWWGSGPTTIDGPDVGAVFVTLQARLVVDRRERFDDRDTARYMVQVGADYYPDTKTQVSAFAPVSYNPGIGLSRFKLVKPEWQAFNFATIDVGVQDPGGAAITVADFRRAPPPLE